MISVRETTRAPEAYCKRGRVSIYTGVFNSDDAKYARGPLITLPYPSDDMRLLTNGAVDAVGRVFQPGSRDSEAEEMLLGARPCLPKPRG